ncbi:MAG: hypothetical protein C0392_15790 [Syntrophus sp. (in: bacteria)]|nr:hypothetical protein [Syntrophus sp. (in: bacteria)]
MSVIKENTNLRTLVVSICAALIALGLLVLGAKIPDSNSTWKALLNSLGSVLFASIAIAVIWQLFQKRSFRQELLECIGSSENIQSSGIEGVYYRFDEVDWKDLFNDCTEFDLFITYGRS